MSDEGRGEVLTNQESPWSRLDGGQPNAEPPSFMPEVPLGVSAQTDYKNYTFSEWYWKADAGGRVIVHWYPYMTLTLVRTTASNGSRLLYLNAACPNVRVWNPFVQNHRPMLKADILGAGGAVLVHADFGTVTGGCGILYAYNKTLQIEPDIFDAARAARFLPTTFRWVSC